MAQKIEKHLPLFRLLVNTTDTQRRAIVKTLSPTQLRAVLEAIYNVLRGTCPIRDKIKKSLYQQRRIIRRLVSTELTREQQQRQLVKHRGIVPLLLQPVIDFLAHPSADVTPSVDDGSVSVPAE